MVLLKHLLQKRETTASCRGHFPPHLEQGSGRQRSLEANLLIFQASQIQYVSVGVKTPKTLILTNQGLATILDSINLHSKG